MADIELPPHVTELLESYDENCEFIRNEALKVLHWNTEISVFNGLRNLSSQQCLKALDRISTAYRVEKDFVMYFVSLAVLTEYICTAYRNTHLYETFHVALSKTFNHVLFDKLCLRWHEVYRDQNLRFAVNTAEFASSFKILKYSEEKFPASFTYKYKLRDIVRRGEEVIAEFQLRKSLTDQNRVHSATKTTILIQKSGTLIVPKNSTTIVKEELKNLVPLKTCIPGTSVPSGHKKNIVPPVPRWTFTTPGPLVARGNVGTPVPPTVSAKKIPETIAVGEKFTYPTMEIDVEKKGPLASSTPKTPTNGLKNMWTIKAKVGAEKTSALASSTPTNVLKNSLLMTTTKIDVEKKSLPENSAPNMSTSVLKNSLLVTTTKVDLEKKRPLESSTPNILKNSLLMNSIRFPKSTVPVVDLTKSEEVLEPPKKKIVLNAFDILMKKKPARDKMFVPPSPKVT